MGMYQQRIISLTNKTEASKTSDAPMPIIYKISSELRALISKKFENKSLQELHEAVMQINSNLHY